MQRETIDHFAGRAGYIFGVVLLLSVASWSQATETVLHSFSGADGEYPNGGLIFDAAGNLYGTTRGGGTCGASTSGCGLVFELSPSSGGWTETILHTFGAAYGETPTFGVVMDTQGNLYGTTIQGGAYNAGTVYELVRGKTHWTEQVLYSFTGGSDGGSPNYGVILDSSGNLYGTTLYGGANSQGVLFQLKPGVSSGWVENVLLNFNNLEGTGPSPLVFDANGNLYGTAESGEFNNNNQRGTLFELSPSIGGGWTAQVLYAFRGPATAGFAPASGVVFDPVGNFYGVNSAGGYGDSFGGTVFELTPGTWKATILLLFSALPASNHPPLGPVALDSSGNVYGTVGSNGSGGGGAFRAGPSGTSLYGFAGRSSTDGLLPQGGVVLDVQANMYGSTETGGTYSKGTVFELTFH